MIGERIACLEQFHGESAQFTVNSWDFVRKLQDLTILAVTCNASHPSDSL